MNTLKYKYLFLQADCRPCSSQPHPEHALSIHRSEKQTIQTDKIFEWFLYGSEKQTIPTDKISEWFLLGSEKAVCKENRYLCR